MAKRPSPHSFMAGMSILSLTVGDNVYAAPGRNAVFAGHEHNYYREIRDDNGDGLQLPYTTTGLGGAGRDVHNVGASLLTITDQRMLIEFYTVTSSTGRPRPVPSRTPSSSQRQAVCRPSPMRLCAERHHRRRLSLGTWKQCNANGRTRQIRWSAARTTICSFSRSATATTRS